MFGMSCHEACITSIYADLLEHNMVGVRLNIKK